VEVVVVHKYYNNCLLSIAGPFFHWWYGFLEKIPGVVLGQATSKLNKSQQNLVNFIVKLAVNQLVMTPPFLLFTLAYIQYFLSLDAHKTVRAIQKSFAAALFTNWKVLYCLCFVDIFEDVCMYVCMHFYLYFSICMYVCMHICTYMP
jgi:hypothetical protein